MPMTEIVLLRALNYKISAEEVDDGILILQGTPSNVILSSSVTSRYGSPLRQKDLEEILELVKNQKHPDVRHTLDSTSSDSSSDEDSANSVYGLLRNMDVIDLIQKANKNKNIQKGVKKRVTIPVFRNYEINRHKDNTQYVLENLLQNLDKTYPKQEKHQRLTPNNLLEPITFEDNRELQTNDLNDYSKIFVILDPLAIRKSRNKDAFTNLVSKILSMSSSSEKARQEINKSNRYKEFTVKNNLLSRRYRRESKEGFGGGSAEDEYKPKRPRNDHGGGGTGGRTAIPYIRQRGDIYERDH